jgi:hypothetical protein
MALSILREQNHGSGEQGTFVLSEKVECPDLPRFTRPDLPRFTRPDLPRFVVAAPLSH